VCLGPVKRRTCEEDSFSIIPRTDGGIADPYENGLRLGRLSHNSSQGPDWKNGAASPALRVKLFRPRLDDSPSLSGERFAACRLHVAVSLRGTFSGLLSGDQREIVFNVILINGTESVRGAGAHVRIADEVRA
jgi:hypothetical protein